MGLDRAHTLPTLPEKSTRGHLFWKSKSPKEEQPLKGGTHERHKTSWFGSSHSKHGGPDSAQGSARHSRTHSLENQAPSAQNSDTGASDVGSLVWKVCTAVVECLGNGYLNTGDMTACGAAVLLDFI